MRKLYTLLFLLLFGAAAQAQVLLNDLMDTASAVNKGFFSLYQQYNWLRFSGYLQPQWQHAESHGAPSFNGGDFLPGVDNRFSLRRGRMRIDYQRRDSAGYPVAQLVFQFDGTERGFFTRDFWGRVFENRWHALSLTGGIFARPFGYELPLGSSDRESPERGRASQTLMRVERDIGAMLTLEPMKKGGKGHWLRADLAVTNGQGLNATTDYDSHKDVIGRVYCKPRRLNRAGWTLSGGFSVLDGGIVSNNALIYRNAGAMVVRDSGAGNVDRLMNRNYYGADVQFRIPNGRGRGFTELRGEYLRGEQTGSHTSSETPTFLQAGLTTRKFDAAYFYFLQNLGSQKHQLVVKYDWYDPNTDVAGNGVSSAAGHNAADVKFSTIGGGYLWYATPNIRLMLYYDHPMNEKTDVAGYAEDLKDDVFTARLQFRF